MPCATCMPCTSSGEVSLRTSTTCSPALGGGDAVVAVEVRVFPPWRPAKSEPGGYDVLRAIVELGVQHLFEVLGAHPGHGRLPCG